jgi:hypothetical protein
MKYVYITVILSLSGVIMYLTNQMQNRPFNSSNMREAYYHGCNIGLHAPLTNESVDRCEKIAEGFKEFLDRD